MVRHEISMDTLSAYVDGELDTADCARVAEAIADDAELARQVMILSRLKFAVADSVGERLVTLPPKPFRRTVRRLALAVFALISVGLGAFYIQWAPSRSAAPVAMLAAAHTSWLAESDIAHTRALLNPVRASAALMSAYIPNLTASRLEIAHVGFAPFRERERLVVGYKGNRGCRVTLIVHEVVQEKDDDVTEIPQFQTHDGKLLARWRVGALDYAMVSTGMSRTRFDLIIGSVAEATVRHAPFNTETRMALMESRANSKPCART